ncbi:MAG: YibE/F family protein [Oscillospiraceae bacterium]|jgi:uncharacterized membrane protein|nr:YibE/F family protein [Oscillospiraceae bacterium]
MRKQRDNFIIFGIVLVLSAVLLATGRQAFAGFISLAEPGTEYCRARVLATDNTDLLPPKTGGERLYGDQFVTLELLGGAHKGETVTAQNFIVADSYLFPKVGDTLIVNVAAREGGLYCRLTSFYRLPGILFLLAVFVLATVLTCRSKGVRALLGLAFTMLMIVCFTIPRIYNGASPALIAMITGAVTAGVSLLLLNGFHKKTLASVLSTCTGFGAAGVLFAVFCRLSNVSGYNAQQLGMLSYFQTQTGLQVKHILFAGVLIASLGAVMDVSMSVTSAVHEIHKANPAAHVRVLFKAGMEVAKDTVGTMTNTLILAFTGGALASLIALTGYGIQVNRFFNSDFIAVEIGEGLSASAALVLMAPLTALISALLFGRKKAAEGNA